jgi:group I intron endonuclease
MEERRDHKIYKYTNKVNGKVYIGRTCQTLEARANGNGKGYKHCTYFYNAIKKYGWENFIGEILEENLNDKEAGEREVYYINLFDSTNKEKGYNLRDSDYRTYKDETREKMRTAQLGKKHSEEARKKMSEQRKGRKMPESLKKKLLAANTGKKRPKEVIEKVRQANLGKKRSEETKRKMSELMKGKYAGEKHPNWGKKLSKEQKEKLRKSRVGLHLSEETREKLSKAIKGKGGTKIKCIETGVEYSSLREASEKTGISSGSISSALRHKGRAGNVHWVYLEEPKKGVKRNFRSKVQCVETGVIYESIADASRKTGISQSSIQRAASSEGDRIGGGYHWKRIEETIHKIRVGGRKVLCVETGVIYESVTAAGEAIGVDRRAISSAIIKGHKSAGYHWRYADTPPKD